MDVVNILLKPSSFSCNLNCSYCFYKKTSELCQYVDFCMTEKSTRLIIENILTVKSNLTSFCWQGGEPTLLGVDFYEKVIKFQNIYNNSIRRIENSLQTNGILINESWCNFLSRNNFLVGISLDGPEQIHNQYRIFANGEGSFNRVMRSIGLLKKFHVPFNILTLLTDANIAFPESLYNFFLDYNFDYLQFIPCVEGDSESGVVLPYSVDALELGKFYCRLFDLWMEDGFPYVSVRLFEDILLFILDGSSVSCNWREKCDSYVLVEHNGDCYPCDFFVRPVWKLGNLLEDSFESILNNPLRIEFANLKADIPIECKSCKLKFFCNGDCTRFRSISEGNVVRSRFCATWKMLIEHIASVNTDLVQRALNLRMAHYGNLFEATSGDSPCPCKSSRQFDKCCGRRKFGAS